MTKLLIIGFDGMDHYMTKITIKGHPFKNFDPSLQRLMTRNTHTGPSWASFYTGLPVEIHGVNDDWGRNILGSNIFQDIQNYAFWNLVRQEGFEVFTENLPITPDGFPFDPVEEKDIVNWIYDPLKEGMAKWRAAIKEMGPEKVITRCREDAFHLINEQGLSNKDLIFIQFSFLDRIGHCFSFGDDRVMKKCYTLVYDIIDRLVDIVAPQYLIVVSDHGFWKNTRHHTSANSAVLILNSETLTFFRLNRVFKLFSIFTAFEPRRIRQLLANFPFTEFLKYYFHINFVKQTDVSDVTLKMFNINYEKPKKKIPKAQEIEEVNQIEAQEIKERLKRLGYL